VKKKNIARLVLLMLVLTLVLSACSARNQVRFEGTLDLGELPSDMLYVNETPQIITVSTESDGDVILAYYSNDKKHVYAQLYGCAYISLNCGDLHKQGRYQWTITGN
jgi:hypothetical protein